MKQRNLDGIYFCVFRDGKWESICFSDMTEEERRNVIEGKPREFLETVCLHLAEVLRSIGDEMDLERRE